MNISSMKKITVLLIVLLPITLFSQRHKPCRSAIDIIVSPEYFTPPSIEADASYTPKMAFRVGTNINLFSSAEPYFVFRSGFRYAQYKYDVKGFFSPQISHEKPDFIEIPLVFRYYWGLNTWRFYVEAQSSMNLSFTKSKEIDKHITAGGAIGLEYCLDKNLALFIQPTFRKPILRNLSNESIDYSFSMGLEMGVKFRY
jgi:Outer membrane protein beta-barrel domain